MTRIARLAVAAAVALGAAGQSLMPRPARLARGAGELVVDAKFTYALRGEGAVAVREAARWMAARLERQTGIPLAAAPAAGQAVLVLECPSAGAALPQLGEDESYRLEVTSSGARLAAPRPVGLLRGMETFLQLVETGPAGFAAPAVTIEDRPRFPWRGLTFDSSRRFMPVDAVKRTLDGMAAVKMNVFHWHLTDDQGFRIESRRYPKLHQMGSGGQYYTQEEAREIVRYAAARGIRVVPEFDMPGHTTSWFVGHPELASAPGPYRIERAIGIHDPAMDPTREEVYAFLDSFLGEMAALFPDPYLHIGGDEVNGRQWNATPRIQAFIRERGLKDNHGLQAYFNRRLLAILQKHGKTPVGWDEVLQPGVPRELVIQSWRGRKALAEAARQGHRVLLSNGYYLDLLQPAEQHYLVDPLGGEAAALPPEAQARVLGGEACMWMEFVSPENVDARTWPRAAAVAERFWSPADVRDVASMYRRIEDVSRRLEFAGLTHRANPRLMLMRLAGTADIGPLETLAEAVEPVKNYNRGPTREYYVTYPLNRFVDAVPAESGAAREFGLLVESAIAGDAPSRRAVRERLAAWRGNDARLRPLIERSGLLRELAPVSQALAALAQAGMEALDAMEKGRMMTAAWQERQVEFSRTAGLAPLGPAENEWCRAFVGRRTPPEAAAKQCAALRPAAQLLLVVAPHVRKLIEAAPSRR